MMRASDQRFFLFWPQCITAIVTKQAHESETTKKAASRVNCDPPALPDLPPYYVNHFYPTLFRATLPGLDFLSRGKITVLPWIFTQKWGKKGLIFMCKSRADSPRSPILRAFWRLPKSRRYDTEHPSVKKQEIKCAKVRVSRIWLWEIMGRVPRNWLFELFYHSRSLFSILQRANSFAAFPVPRKKGP